eukprot:TRINITY_DN28795_c0_g1_i1.p1 TRINITY_DN28795_c0_g1~~TRINITY_DN28795_c0_g1_i1.p1  ORF type:complete len:331 (+),score=130.08 TRINITY_DN28795_c0_g1_i1:85-1077(+)
MGVDTMKSMMEQAITPSVVSIEGRYKTVLCLHAPLPEEESKLPPPNMRREYDREMRNKELVERSGDYQEKKDEYQKKEKKSFMEKAQAKLDSVSHKVDKLKTEATQSAYDKVAEKMDKDAEERFTKHFTALSLTEKLLYHDYYCTLVNQIVKETTLHRSIEGYMAVTDKSFLFMAAGSGHDPTFRVDLRDIVSIRRSIKLETVDLNPHCMPLPTPRVLPQGIMIYTRQGHVHRFYDFKPTVGMANSGSNLTENAFGLIDYAWRTINPVIPLPDYQYDCPLGIEPSAPPASAMHDVMLRGAAMASNASAAIDEAKSDPKKAIMEAKAKFGK